MSEASEADCPLHNHRFPFTVPRCPKAKKPERRYCAFGFL